MAFFDNMKKQHMSKQDHMREDARKADEGTEYRGAKRGSRMDTFRKDEHGGYHSGRSFEGSRQGGYQERNDSRKGGFQDRGSSRPSYGRDNAKGGFEKKNENRGGFAPRGEQRRPAATRSYAPARPAAPKTFAPARPASPAPVRPAPAPVRVKPMPVEELPENLLMGRNPIREALKAGRDIEKLLVAKGDLSGTAREIVGMARELHIPVQMVERVRLDEITRNHQGMIAYASAYKYADVDDILNLAAERGEAPFIIIMDGVTDPHNLGAVIRTAAAVGAHGVIVPERRAVGLTPAAVKASAGGIEHIPVARVINLTNEIKKLKDLGVWFYAADANGEDYRQVDFNGPCALIIGSEGDGISRLVREQCDRIVSIPMSGDMESLNASVAAGILMYTVKNARG